MKRFIVCAGCALLILSSRNFVSGQDSPIDKLLMELPPRANSVLVADLFMIGKSDIATKNNWFSSLEGKIGSGMGFLPAGGKQVVLGSHIDYQQFVPSWTATLITLDQAPDLKSIANRSHGTVDQLAGQSVVATDHDLLVFQAGDALATFSPANRQLASAWITNLSNNESAPLDDYLGAVVSQRDETAGLFVAFDMSNLVSPASVKARADEADSLKEAGIDSAKFSTALASLRGVAISVVFDNSIKAAANIDFGQNVDLLKPVAKQLILEIMENYGIHVAELANWTATVDGNQIQFRGELSEVGLRRLISLFDSPDPGLTAAPASGDADSQPSMADSTKQYYDSVSSMVSELRKEIGVGGQSLYKYGRWIESYADKIDALSMDNVDPDMLDFGAYVSKTLRDLNQQISFTHQSVDVQNSNLMAYGNGSPALRYRGYGYGYGGYGYGVAYPWRYYGYGVAPGAALGAAARAQARNNLEVFRQKQDIHTQARAGVIDSGSSAFQSIAESETAIRRTMTERYPGTFK